jgi:HK97 family phage major capsid protein
MRASEDSDLLQQARENTQKRFARAAAIAKHVPEVDRMPRAIRGAYALERSFIGKQWLEATVGESAAARTWCRDFGIDCDFHAAHNETANELGGFLVPIEIEQSIIDLKETYGAVAANINIMPMAGDTKRISHRVGGLTPYFAGDSQTLTESTMNWNAFELHAKKMSVLTRISNELSIDSFVPVVDKLVAEIAWAFAKKEDEIAFSGDGTSTYGHMTGLLNKVGSAGVVNAATNHTGYSTLTLDDWNAALATIAHYADDGDLRWYVSRAGYFASMQKLMEAGGGNRYADLQGGTREKTFLGVNVVISQALNRTLGADVSQPKAILANLKKGAIMGVRRGMAIKVSDQRYFESDEIGIRATQRFDFAVTDPGDSTTAGSVVVLKSAAS